MNELLKLLLADGAKISFVIPRPRTHPDQVNAQIEIGGVCWQGYADSALLALHAAARAQMRSLLAK